MGSNGAALEALTALEAAENPAPKENTMPGKYGLLRYIDSKRQKSCPPPVLRQSTLKIEGNKWKLFSPSATNLRDLFLKLPSEIRYMIYEYLFSVRYYVPVTENGMPTISRESDPAIANLSILFSDKELGAEAVEAFIRVNTFCIDVRGVENFAGAENVLEAPSPLRRDFFDTKIWLRSLKIAIPCWDFHQDKIDGINSRSDAIRDLYTQGRTLLALPALKQLEVIISIHISCHWRQELTAKLTMLLHALRKFRAKGILQRVTLRHYEHECHAGQFLAGADDDDDDSEPDDDDLMSDTSSNSSSVSLGSSNHMLDYDGVDIDTASITSDVSRTRFTRGITFPTFDDDEKNVYMMWQRDPFPESMDKVGQWVYSDVDVAWWFDPQDEELRERFFETEHPLPMLWHYGYHEIEHLLENGKFPKRRLTRATMKRMLGWIEATWHPEEDEDEFEDWDG
ncbi:MAG: hypothetical protein MMC23_005083 [Stictis urceolatum]|nr:hypothetical protein [Stictis urceolata]